MQLLAQVLLNTEGDRPAVAKYRQLIDQLEQAASCDVPGWQPSKKQCADPVVRLGRDGAAYTIEQVGSLTSQRLIYTIPYEQREGVRGPKVDGRVPVFERESAMQMADIDRSFLADRVVVIGGTYRESRDWYATPIGEMPGAMVVINAVHSLGANGFLHPPPVWMKFAIVACLVLMMSLVFAWLDSFPALLAASAFVLMLLVPVSFLMFRYGVWVDFALPLLAVQLHEFTAEFESIEKKRKNRASEQVSKKQATPDHSSAGAETTSTTKDRAESA